MNSNNFNLLNSRWPDLYHHASFAETYVVSEPTIAIIKLRCFVESLVGYLYKELGLPSTPNDGLFEKIKSEHFELLVESPIREKLHAIRCLGNKAAHGGLVSADKAAHLLKEAYLLGRWLYRTYNDEVDEYYPAFSLPECGREQEKLSAKKNDQLELVKQELADVQAAEQAAQEKIAELKLSLNEAQLTAFKNASARATSTMDLDEQSTRRLLNIEDAFGEYSLNEGQTELINRLGDFLSNNTESTFLLRGYAGTGKTFITKGLTEYFRSIGRNYVLAAPTGKASKVISSKTESLAYTLHKTIYCFKDIAEYLDNNISGTETL